MKREFCLLQAKCVSAKDKENEPHSGIDNTRMLVQGCHLTINEAGKT